MVKKYHNNVLNYFVIKPLAYFIIRKLLGIPEICYKLLLRAKDAYLNNCSKTYYTQEYFLDCFIVCHFILLKILSAKSLFSYM